MVNTSSLVLLAITGVVIFCVIGFLCLFFLRVSRRKGKMDEKNRLQGSLMNVNQREAEAVAAYVHDARMHG